jgi:hypothetical protein
MRVRSLTFLFLILTVLFAGATAWALPAADDAPAASSAPLSFRLPTPAFEALPGLVSGANVSGLSAAAGSGNAGFSRLSLRLYGGYAYLGANDVNAGADGYFGLMRLYEAAGNGTMTGGYKPLHGGLDLGGDLVFQITPRFGVGVGVGYVDTSRDSVATLTGLDLDVTLTETVSLKAMPVRLGVFFDFPVASKLSLTADAGADWYTGLKLSAANRLAYTDGSYMDFSFSGARSGLSGNIGFHGDLGLEYKLSRSLGFIVEAAGRYARLKTFNNAVEALAWSDGSSNSQTGTLYVAHITVGTEGTFTMFYVSDTPPVDKADETFRVPKFDFSGVSLRAGLHIHF